MKTPRLSILVSIFTLVLALLSCTQKPDATSILQSNPDLVPKAEKKYTDLIVGYAQLGAESEWRVANTISIKETAEQLGVELRFLDAQQKQENQIEAVRKLIIQKVDVIGISPIVETGWDEVFQEAKDAGIPIILVDRRADVPEDLYDNDDMALGAIQAIEEYGLKPGKDIKIVSIDAARGAFEAMIAGKLNATVECNPLLGPQFFELALDVVNGKPVPKWVPSIESIFFPEDASKILPTRKY